MGAFRDGLALFRIGELTAARFGYLNEKGVEVIPAVFRGANNFSEGLAGFKVGNLWGYIYPSGIFAITPHFEGTYQAAKRIEDIRAGHFVDGLAPVWLGKAYGFIDTAGKLWSKVSSIRPKTASVRGALLIEQQRKCGFIDRNGSIVIEPQFSFARDFSERLARVTEKESQLGFSPPSGFIDPEGNMVIAVKFRSGNSFENGLCLVETEDSIGYINKMGEFVWQGPYVEYRVVI